MSNYSKEIQSSMDTDTQSSTDTAGQNNMKKTILGILVSAFCFSTMEIALKIGGNSLDPIQMTFLRFFIGGLVLTPFAVRETRARMAAGGLDRKVGESDARRKLTVRDIISARDLGWVCLVGIVGVSISMLFFQFGVGRSNAATAAALISTTPLFTMLIAHIFTSEKMDRLRWIAFAIGLMAIVFMTRPWDIQEGNSIAGIIFMLCAAIAFGVYTVMGKRTLERVGLFTQTALSFFVGSLVLLVVLWLTRRPVIAGVADQWILVLYAGVVVTGIGYLFYFLGVQSSDATTGSITYFIKPILAPALAMLILHETILWNTVLGIALLTLASFITLYDARRHR